MSKYILCVLHFLLTTLAVHVSLCNICDCFRCLHLRTYNTAAFTLRDNNDFSSFSSNIHCLQRESLPNSTVISKLSLLSRITGISHITPSTSSAHSEILVFCSLPIHASHQRPFVAAQS